MEPTDTSRPVSLESVATMDHNSPLPSSPVRSAAAARRHAKGLSLNFPILLPTATASNSQLSPSPTSTSALATPLGSTRSSPHTRAVPFKGAPSTSTSGAEAILEGSSSTVKTRGSADFLTLLAAQERKVLELKEELHKAEADLLGLKKQWASYEANKKRQEVKHVKKLQPLALDHVTASPVPEDEVDEERRRKRALVERSMTLQSPIAGVNGAAAPGLGRRGSKRVFEGRHTRTLSLLSPTSARSGHARASVDLGEGQVKAVEPFGGDDDNDGRPSLSRMPTLDGIISGDPLQFGFGKTYKDLAAHRRSLPPVPTDLLVKQGKQVYDGVREGLWTFFEDIRQATVGEEGVSGTAAQQRPPRAPQKKPGKRPATRESKAKSPVTDTSTGQEPAPAIRTNKEPSFWNEFGLDTPHKPITTATKTDKQSGHVQQKSSTDSSSPPSLLPDSNDDDLEDSWDVWDSPVSARAAHAPEQTSSQRQPAAESLPWPEIQKLTPSKLTRTVSDLMREWESGQRDDSAGQQQEESNDDSAHFADADAHFLTSPHI